MHCFKNGKKLTDDTLNDGKNCLYLVQFDEVESLTDKNIVNIILDGANIEECASKHETYENYDTIHMNITEELRDSDSVEALALYIKSDQVVCAYKLWDKRNDNVLKVVVNSLSKSNSIHKAALSIIDMIIRRDYDYLGALEDKISKLEESVQTANTREAIIEINDLRNKLKPMKRLYEQLIDTLEDIDENENSFFSEVDLKYCARIWNKVERLLKTVLNLRDYVTQVREAYQSQIDIGLNEIMKMFTVLTAIFLPLTLLVGWYGMNLQMPEFNWPNGYAYVIGLSALIVIGSLFYFKQKKWF